MPAIVELAPRAARALPHAPSAALVEDAGSLAHGIALVWPRPHAPYFAAESARRRLAAFIAYNVRGSFAEAADRLANWSLKRIAAFYLPGAPAGFVEALRRIDDGPWKADDYHRLADMLADSEGAKTLRHAPRLDREMVAVVAALPRELRRARILAVITSVHVASLAAKGAKRACGYDARALEQLGDRLERARSVTGLFRMLIEAIGLEQLAPPPVPGTKWFLPLATTTQIERAALRFANCLKGRIPLLLRGRAAYYEVVGEEPAIVEIVRDATGLWVIGEVRGHANRDISGELWDRIRAHLELHGARVRFGKADQLAIALAQVAGW